ncbi:MAG: terpene cyclase/mutase family protein, partial [Planctomycetes bacterium]|nr:terpene cyclase/mutase family protein [Planctomycetota bacterium]
MRAFLCCCMALLSFSALAEPSEGESPRQILTDTEWERVNKSVDQALEWLAHQQNPDGSFPTSPTGQPAVSSLCTMAFLAQGHLPGEGKYGDHLQKALDYIVSCQKRNGILAAVAPNGSQISRTVQHNIGYTVSYNHAIAGLVLSESFSMAGSERTKTTQPVIQKALDVSFAMQDWPNEQDRDKGGWRYLDDYEHIDSDLSITGWQLMFLRSAKNAGFEVEQQRIERAVAYVRRCFLKDKGTFTYKLERRDRASRGMAGAGILALAHSGLHHTSEAQRAGDWVLKSGFQRYNAPGRVTGDIRSDDRYHYGLLLCSQAMYQLGGRHWREFFPPMVKVLISGQNADGSWQADV